MMINATLLVQIANFIVAYYVLRFFFLAPVSRVVEQEDATVKKQHEAIKDQKSVIEHHIAIKREAWQHCQKYFRENSPSMLVRTERKEEVAVVTVRELPDTEMKKMRESVTKRIISEVSNVS